MKFILTASLFLNVYLFYSVIQWQDSWLEQFITTSHIEKLYQKSGADISFKSIKELVDKEIGGTTQVENKEVILIDGTRLFFKNGQFIGSKANLPDPTFLYLSTLWTVF